MLKYFTLLFLFAGNMVFAQNDNLHAIGIPDNIPTTLNKDVLKYTKAEDFLECIGWDRKGKNMLFNGGKYIYSMKGANSNINVLLESNEYFNNCFSNNHKKFLFTEDENGDENYQLFLYDLVKKQKIELTNRGYKSSDPFWCPDGLKIVFKSNKRNAAHADLYIKEVNSPYKEKILFEDFSDDGLVYDWDERSGKILAVKIISENDKKLYLIDTNTNESQCLNSAKPGIAYSQALFIPNTNKCFIVSDEDSEFQQLHIYDIDTRKSVLVNGIPDCDITSLSLDKQGKHAVFTVNRNGVFNFYSLDIPSLKINKIEIQEGVIKGLYLSPDGKRAVFNLYGSTFKRKVYMYDFSSNILTQIMQKGAAKKDFFDFITAQQFTFNSNDSITAEKYKISAFIYKPQNSKKSPVYIDVHGGPEYQALPTFSAWHQYLVNELGITVIIPNIRGSNGYGKSFMKADDVQLRENAVYDIGALLDWIALQPDLDKNKVAIFGESYGGYIVLSSLGHYGNKIKCGIDVVGISDWVTFLGNTADYRKDLRRVEFGDERDPEINKFLQRISPTNFSEKIVSPLYIVQGYNDPRVNYRISEQIAGILRSQNKTVWYLMAMNEGHGFRKVENRAVQRNAEILFLQKYLLE